MPLWLAGTAFLAFLGLSGLAASRGTPRDAVAVSATLRLARALELVKGKQGDGGRWKLEHTYNGKTWVDIEAKGAPSKWVTLRALRVLKAACGE